MLEWHGRSVTKTWTHANGRRLNEERSVPRLNCGVFRQGMKCTSKCGALQPFFTCQNVLELSIGGAVGRLLRPSTNIKRLWDE